jgi:PHD/YefM family antitoxin component YafN of YafNO toxin-antitoxin module
MQHIIKPSSDLRRNYNSIAQICKTERAPVFLTKNGEGDTVLMDIDTFNQREEDIENAFRLLEAQRARGNGAQGQVLDDFEANMKAAIAKGARNAA